MDFELTEEQESLRGVARDLFAKLYAPDRLRAVWDGAPRDPEAWRAMAEVGLTALTTSADFGGVGGDVIDLFVVLEEAGRACVPEPLVETVAVAAPLLAGTELAGQWLPRIAAGDAIVTLLLDGQPFAVDADIAGLLLYEQDGALLATDSFEAEPVESEDRSRRLFTVRPDGGVRIGGAAQAHVLASFATATLLNGVSVRLLEMAVEHATVRRQFDQPIGAFQAVKHALASVFTDLEASRAAARYAAYAIAHEQDDAATAANVAKINAAATGARANTAALQVHAGIGFTWEHDLHLWLKRGRALEHAYGSARDHRAALAATLLD